MLKILLLALSVLSCSEFIHAAEHRVEVIDRFDPDIQWSERTIPGLIEGSVSGGTLSIAHTLPIRTIDPYTSRIADDVFYESLFATDPTGTTERMYALVAQAVRFDDDMKYVVFEINPNARFHDGTSVTGKDVLFSAGVFIASSSANKKAYEDAVAKITLTNSEVRFDLRTTGQASRHALMMLAGLKIVKPDLTIPKMTGKIPVKYASTGPYALGWLSENRVSFVYNRDWWGAHLRSRQGLFHLKKIDVTNYGDPKLARMWVAHGNANYYSEAHPRMANALLKTLQTQNSKMDLAIEKVRFQTQKPALLFNFNRSLVQDVRVRRAIMLAYDSDEIGNIDYEGHWSRPIHLADSSPMKISDLPSEGVAKLMSMCTAAPEVFGDFSSYGHSLFASAGGRRERLLKAQKLLEEAGLTLKDGQLQQNGQTVSFRLYAPDLESKALYYFEANLLRLGFDVYAGARYEDSKSFDVYSGPPLEFLSKDGHVFADNLRLPDSPYTPCLNALLGAIHNNWPNSKAYQDSSEALVRLTEALQMFIFTGQPSERYYFRDEKLELPKTLSFENAHLYGYIAIENWRVSLRVPPNIACADMGCLFRGGF